MWRFAEGCTFHLAGALCPEAPACFPLHLGSPAHLSGGSVFSTHRPTPQPHPRSQTQRQDNYPWVERDGKGDTWCGEQPSWLKVVSRVRCFWPEFPRPTSFLYCQFPGSSLACMAGEGHQGFPGPVLPGPSSPWLPRPSSSCSLPGLASWSLSLMCARKREFILYTCSDLPLKPPPPRLAVVIFR